MEEQNSILLQKKMILVLSMIVFVLVGILTYVENGFSVTKAIALKEYKDNLITVKKEEIENDIILIEQIAYTASEQIIETENNGDENTKTQTLNDVKENTNENQDDAIIENNNVKVELEKEENVNNDEKTKDNIEDEKIIEVVSSAVETNKTAIDEKSKNEILENEKIEDTKNTSKTENISTINEQAENESTKVNMVSYKNLAEDNPPTEYSQMLEATATAYCLCQKCCGKSPSSPGYGVTASGLKIVPGTGIKVIAVDPKVIPLGTKVYVEGLNGAWDYGYAVAADTGSAIKSLKIDLYMDSHQETLNWGRKKVNVYVMN